MTTPAHSATVSGNQNAGQTTYEQLEEMLADVLDAQYGGSIHHIGDGDGIGAKGAANLQKWYRAYCETAIAKATA